MFRFYIIFAIAFGVVIAQQNNNLPCGFTCTRRASFQVSIDGSFTTATCTAPGADPRDRCNNCCQAKALAAGLQITAASGFPSTNNQDCVCCTNNSRCGRK